MHEEILGRKGMNSEVGERMRRDGTRSGGKEQSGGRDGQEKWNKE